MTAPALHPDITDALSHLIEPGAVFEIRIPEPANTFGTVAGYFDNIEAAAKAAASWSGKAGAVYITPNPVEPALLARANNRLKKLGKKDATTTDADITARRWLLVDLDPGRPAGISSSDAEHTAALVKAGQVRDWLATQGWPAPILADSGNGAHLLYRIDLGNDDDAKALVKTCLEALAGKFDDRNGQTCPVKVDTGVFNASRIWKLYGTLAAKGDNTQDRPHRLARIIETPEAPEVVAPERLRDLAALAPKPEPKAQPQRPASSSTGGDFFKTVNAEAISRLSDWVHTLFPDAQPYRQGYRVTSRNLHRDLEEDLSIQPDGIVDFGVHDIGDPARGRRTPIDLAIEVRGGDAKDAALWLCDQLRIDSASIGWTVKPSRERPVAPAPKTEAAGGMADEDLFSDYGNVVKLLDRLQVRIAYTPGLDWLIYNPESGVWEPEPGSERVKRLVLETLREAWSAVLYAAQRDEDDLKKELKSLDSEDPKAAMVGKKVKLAAAHREKVFQWVRQCETAYRIRSTLEIAEGYFWTPPEVWDANQDILVCANGVLDLKTGALLPHSPTYRATKTTGTEYRPEAVHPSWEAATSLLKSEGDRYEFVHQFCGSGLHGANPNERVVIFQGDAGTGKGTLLTAIHRALGDYVQTVEVGSLLATDWRRQNKSAPREDLLKLRGARFVYPAIEPPKDSKLDDGSIKALTGNDAITARYPHAKNSITFTPVFKLAIQTNFPLRTEFDDPGMKRRLVVIPFNQKPERPDPAIKNDLMHDLDARAAVLAWLYEGYRIWRRNGYALPDSMLATAATEGYWADMNPFEQFAMDIGLVFGKKFDLYD